MASSPSNRFRSGRNMPSWVTESSDRVGPPPPPPPANNDPEYEVIDVANQQQYSNAPPPVPLKSPDIKRLTVMKCDLCGSVAPVVRCEQCDQNLFCVSCDDRYHRHPKRQTHVRKPIEPPAAVAPPTPSSTVKPPLPPKGDAGSSGPLPPPRRNKRPGSFHFPSPMFGRKQDQQTIPTTVPQGQPEQQQQQKPPPPPPSPALSLREKMNSLKRFIHPSNRPLPDPPENKIHSSNSSLDTVSKRSPSIGPNRSVSSTMEKIQNNTAATLDRMTLLQQRYRQHQEAMKSDGDRSRRASLTSNTDLQRSEFGDTMPSMPNGPRSLSTSVFNLHQPPPPQPNMWGFNPLHQAQSMAHFNPMQWNQMNAWMGRGSQNGSNMSLNLPPQHGYPPQDPAGYPPGWTNTWNGMYPYPMGMMPMMPGVAMPPPRSRANSRSRAASPALSVKSRKSTMSMRNLNRNSFIDDLTDDEDSDDGFHRSRGRGGDRRRRERLNSTSSMDFDEPEPPAQSFVRASSVKHSRFNRDRRGGGSSARSLIDYPVSRKVTAPPARYDREELVRDRFDKLSVSSARKEPSDSFTNDSDLEQEGRRVTSNRSRSGNESLSSPRKINSDSMTNDSDADFERRRQAKLKAAQNNLAAARRITSYSHTNDSEPEQDRRRQQKSKPAPLPAPKKPIPSSDSDGREKQRRKSDTKKSDSGKVVAAAPKKIPSDSHTPDTDGSDQRRRFASKQQRQRKHSSTEFIANESDNERPEKVVNGLLEFRTISPTKSDSDELRHLKTVEIKNIINDTRSEVEPDNGEVPEQSPPPPALVAPDREWECEFCTYVNEPGVKICAICCKTATISAVGGGATKQDSETRSPPPDVVQEIEVPQVTEVKLQIVPPQKPANGKPPGETKKKDVDDEMDTEMDQIIEGEVVSKSCSDGISEGRNRSLTPEKKQSVDIQPSFDADPVRVEKKVAKEKVSTGCGPSPPREIVGVGHSAAAGERPRHRASIGTSPPPQDMSTQQSKTMDDHQDPEDMPQGTEQLTEMQNGSTSKEEPSEMTLLLREAERYHFTAEELQAAMNHCGEKHPVQWLRSNWNKLIETVQTLATKYGHEKRENTIGTISTVEAREALRMHKGNIWRAITECIEQRQRKYREIASKGNFTREDIVTSLTAHHGNLELATIELSKTQLKPFLMRIWGPPSGADNDSGNLLLQQALQEDRTGISSEIQQFISAHVEQELLGTGPSEKVMQPSEPELPSAMEQADREEIEPEIQQLTEHENTKAPTPSLPEEDHLEEVCEAQSTTTTSNTEILKDIEALIMQMERKQESSNGTVLRNIQQLLSQLVDAEPNSRSPSATSIRSQASDQRIMSKSPIPVRNGKQPDHLPDPNRSIEDDVRDFVQENIQDILPNLVQQVRQELDAVKVNLQTKPKSLEDDIRETLMRAEYSENDYSNIHYFPFDKTPEPPVHFPERQQTSKVSVQPSVANDTDEYANIQKFLERAIRNEKTTTVFDQMKRSNYLIDSSSDEARQTAESTDYYDLVSINEKLMHLFTKTPSKESQPVQQHEEASKTSHPEGSSSTTKVQSHDQTATEEATRTPQGPEEPIPQESPQMEKKGVKKRRGSRIPVNKNNYLYRRPVKSSSESDFEVLATNAKQNQSSIAAIDHVEEMRHVVENIERIEQTMDVEDAPEDEDDQEDFELIDEPIYINLPPKKESEAENVEQLKEVEDTTTMPQQASPVAESTTFVEPIKDHHTESVMQDLTQDISTPQVLPQQSVEATDAVNQPILEEQKLQDSTPAISNTIQEPPIQPVESNTAAASIAHVVEEPKPIQPQDSASQASNENQQQPIPAPSAEENIQTHELPITASNETNGHVQEEPQPTVIAETPVVASETIASSSAPNESIAVKSEPPTNDSLPDNSNNISEADQQDDVISHSSKLANNLSELVLDTKRLIQQMKDEINSDIATFNEDDAAYEEDYYEDEYEDEWEGEEEEEEWDSNEEYDVDENGDFYEYEDDDDDGSVMFSETIIDSAKSRDAEQPPNEMIPVQEPPQMIMPMINMAIVRENERNSASEVSDLPLDSDFNDAMSVIEQSVGELRNMLHLTEEALGPLDLANPLHHASSVETLQNSPEQSEISEITLVPEYHNTTAEESSEPTLVADENVPLTMKDVQTLMNAKAVIGGFIKNVQKIEQTVEEQLQDNALPIEESPIVIYDSVKTSSTETTDNKPPSVIERNVPNGTAAILEEPVNTIDETVVNSSTGVMHSNINSAVQAENLEGVVHMSDGTEASQPAASSPHQPLLSEDNSSVVSSVPLSKASVQEPILTDAPTTHGQLSNGVNGNMATTNEAGHVTEEITQEGGLGILASSTSHADSQPVQATPNSQNISVNNSAIPEYVNADALQSIHGNGSGAPIPEYATVFKASSKLQEIETTNDLTQQPPASIGTTLNTSSEHPATSQEEAGLVNGTELRVTITEDASVPATSESYTVEQPREATVNSQELQVSVESAIDDHLDHLASESLKMTNDITQTTLQSIQPESTQNQLGPGDLANTSNNPIPMTDGDVQSLPHQSTTTNVTTEQQPPEPNANNLPNGNASDGHRTQSRASSEEPSSSFVEIQPSQVIIHTPQTETQPQVVPPEAPPRTTNIYQNVDLHPSASSISPTATTITTTSTTTTTTTTPMKSPPTRSKSKASKLTVKVTNAASSQSEDGASPTTPPTPTGQKANAKATASKTKTESKKKSTSTTSSPTADTNGRRPSVTRKKSIGGVFGPVQTNTVKNMQKEFLNKAKESPKPSTSKVAPKPAKLVQPKAFTARSSTTPTASTSKASTPASEDASTSARSTPGLNDANEPQPGSSRDTTYMCEKLMKKKYRETCFSDEYQTTDDEDESHMTVTESERTIIKSLVKPYEPNNEPPEVQAKQLMEDGLVQTLAQAELAVQLIELRYAKDNAIWAATQCHTIDDAKDLLQKECELCLGVFPMNEIISMLKCTHTCCFECAKEYFTQEITNRSITNCNCPYCKEPDLNGPEVTEDDVLEYFSNLDILLKNIVDEEVHDLFQRKIRDRTLTKDPNFKWCVHCSSGFFARPKQRRLVCPDCGSITCASCRKAWEAQHEGLTCEKFAEWKEANDPELQAEGVQRHLQTHGISCPNCKFRYSLARGGCMHFTCTQCKFEFCYGCNKPFMMGAKCSVSPYCAKLGLHAHHPRNCLFYLRDKEPRDLQNLLLMNNVSFDTEPSEQMKQELANGESTSMKCPIPLQKETPAGLMDMICSADVPEKHAGLCRTHYVEYLVGTVSKAQIDPLPILDLTDCVQELRRRGIPLPERGPWDTDEIYREMCQKLVKDKIPLDN
ncbi:E3 ubiquitin-protein ligase lubel isoform X5 [Anopheles merus]|uniref:E3 ubiquitin-protein ligase lubel isoform X5 n=1 Tax=Anopheles merus TaxID=30066 RepID=UPI001BE4D45A|nr:E3 ubiquitin-protein ligase lubel isoform X5 [Anopheles merus]